MINLRHSSRSGTVLGAALLLASSVPLNLHALPTAHAAPPIPAPPPRIITVGGRVLSVPTGAVQQAAPGAAVLASYTVCSSLKGCVQGQASTSTDSQGYFSFGIAAGPGTSVTGSVLAGAPMLTPQTRDFRTQGANVRLTFALLYRYTCTLPAGGTVLLTHVQNATVEALPGAQLETYNGTALQCRLSTADPYYQAINGTALNVFQVPAFPDLNIVHNGLQGPQPVYGTWIY